MKKAGWLTAILLLLGTIVFAQNDTDWHSKVYSVDEFSKINLEGGFRVLLIQGDKSEVVVKAPNNDVFDYIQVKEWGDELIIDIEPDHLKLDRIALYITFQDLGKLHIEGGVRLRTNGFLDLKDFEMYVAGGAKIDLEMKAEDVRVVGEGGVLFDLEGVAESLDVRLSGAGHVDADDLKVKDASFHIEGVGTGSVHATETLYAKIEGVGKVWYTGNPKVTKDIEGLGAVSAN
uniref:head GIN domain-containing protein n=1 Tax=uncultured Draconibacterium sp. TaxID=1573823 RepID=UPI003217C9B9